MTFQQWLQNYFQQVSLLFVNLHFELKTNHRPDPKRGHRIQPHAMNPSHLLSLLAGLLLSLTSSLVHSQELPQGYFRNPLDCNIGLSATFAEFRTGHFHAGLDMRTGGTIGLPVHAAANGYVCGIRISPWGGKGRCYISNIQTATPLCTCTLTTSQARLASG